MSPSSVPSNVKLPLYLLPLYCRIRSSPFSVNLAVFQPSAREPTFLVFYRIFFFFPPPSIVSPVLVVAAPLLKSWRPVLPAWKTPFNLDCLPSLWSGIQVFLTPLCMAHAYFYFPFSPPSQSQFLQGLLDVLLPFSYPLASDVLPSSFRIEDGPDV